jgi:integrase
MSAIRKLAAEAADNGLIAPELAAGIARVKSAKSVGVRTGNWLSVRQAQNLLNAPDVATLRGLRDRAILAVLLGCGLRRSEMATLTLAHVQQRDGRWCIVDRSTITTERVRNDWGDLVGGDSNLKHKAICTTWGTSAAGSGLRRRETAINTSDSSQQHQKG